MNGTCLVCQQKVDLIYSDSKKTYVTEYHQDPRSSDCRGSGHLPQDNTLRANKSKILPAWVSVCIAAIAYEQGHASGMIEVAMIEESMIQDFEFSMKNTPKGG